MLDPDAPIAYELAGAAEPIPYMPAGELDPEDDDELHCQGSCYRGDEECVHCDCCCGCTPCTYDKLRAEPYEEER